ncbi:uncharacterized protein [Leptinotarsa decemlineata]|uniref:uncharacterized protein n=1 Tax=Leptinotarsa decemlineata TaxID=7539 RepID=UPI003D3059B0
MIIIKSNRAYYFGAGKLRQANWFCSPAARQAIHRCPKRSLRKQEQYLRQRKGCIAGESAVNGNVGNKKNAYLGLKPSADTACWPPIGARRRVSKETRRNVSTAPSQDSSPP